MAVSKGKIKSKGKKTVARLRALMVNSVGAANKKMQDQQTQRSKNRNRGMINSFKNTKGSFLKKVRAAEDFESLLDRDQRNERRKRVLAARGIK